MLLAWTTNIALQAERMRSEKSNVGREGQQHIVNKLQWPKIKLGNNIAFSHKDWQKKTRQILIIHIVLCHGSRFFVGILSHWLKNRSFTDAAAPGGLRSWDLKILKIKAEFANLHSVPPPHCSQLQHYLPVLKEESSEKQVKFKRKTNS